eukprot:1275667-Prymnesium_polylepis.1
MRCRAHWWLDTVDGRAEHLAEVLKWAHPWPGRLPCPKSGRNGRTHLRTVEHIWYLVTKTAALHGRIGPHNIWHNICVCAELDG